MTVHVTDAPLSAYAPAVAQPHNVFTISATAMPKGTTPPAPQLRAERSGIVVAAPNPLAALLVRVPQKVDLVVDSQRGDVTVTDISGNARVKAARGNVTLMVPGYAQALTLQGNLKVTMGATDWPGRSPFPRSTATSRCGSARKRRLRCTCTPIAERCLPILA